MADDLKIVADFSDLQLMRRELVGVAKDAKASASVFEREYAKAERQLKSSASSAQKYYAEVYKLGTAQKSAAKSASVFERELVKSDNAAKNLAATKDRLASKYKPLYAQSKLYERSLEEINQANKLGVLTDTQREATLERLNREFATGTGTFSTYANGMTKGSNRMGVAMQQTGYQVGDFLVQVQSGTNPMVAFGQQATQLVGVMYLLPQAALAAKISIAGLSVSLAGITLGLSILIPLLTAAGAAFMRSREASDEAKDGVDSYAEALENLIQKTKELKEERLSLTTDFDKDVLIASEKRIRYANRIIELEVLQKDLKGERLEGNKLLVSILERELDAETKKINVITAAAKAEQEKIDAAEDAAEALEDQERAAERILELSLKISRSTPYIPMSAVAVEVAKAQAEMVKLFEKAMALKEELGEAAFEALRLSGVDLEGNISAGEKAAARLAVQLGVAFGVAQKIQLAQASLSNKNQNYSGRGTVGMPSEQDGSGVFNPSRDTINQADILLGLKDPPKTKGGSKKSPAEEFAEYLDGLKQQAVLEKELVGIFGAKRAEEEAVIKARQKYGEETVARQEAELRGTLRQIEAEKERQRVLDEAKSQQEQVASVIADNFGSAFMSIVDGTKSAKEAFKDMARSIIKQLFQILVVEKMVKSIKSFISPSISAAEANGGAWQGGSKIKAYANGGVVGGPTYFPMAGGKTGLMGEAGPEAIMPLKRGANGKLGVQMEGNAGGDVVINQSFNFQANGDDSVKRIIQQQIPRITEATKAAVVDSKRRGGSYGRAF